MTFSDKLENPLPRFSLGPEAFMTMKDRLPKRLIRAIFIACLLAILPVAVAKAQNHPELDWKTFETDHFKIYYHQGLEKTAGLAAAIAEEAYGPITSLYDYEPGTKVRLIIKDMEDYSNGAAYFYDNKIEIWATSLDSEFRGTRDWLSDVITHEFTHIVSLQASFKASRRVPAAFLQFFGYQQEDDRDDILTDYPDVLVSYALPMLVMPPWFAEGVAQYQAEGVKHDYWDSHRDMILRTAALNGGVLNYSDLSVFEKDGRGIEMVYDHGYSLVSFIAQNFGEDKLKKIAKNMSAWWRMSFSSAIEDAIGISGEKLHREWKQSLLQNYQVQAEEIKKGIIEGEKLKDGGYSNRHPTWSPDGQKLAYLSNKGRDYSLYALYIFSVEEDVEKAIAGGVVSSVSWSPDEEKIIYSKRSKPDKYGSRFWDIYEYGFKRKKEKRLTHGLRAIYPDHSPDGTSITFVRNAGGTNNLGVMNSDGTGVRYLTNFDDWTQLYNPKWSSDGSKILFSISNGRKRDIAFIPADATADRKITYVARSESSDERDACWTPNGDGIIFTSDITGIFNLYYIDLEAQKMHRITNVIGGAFDPCIASDGKKLAFSVYGEDGYEIRSLSFEDKGDPIDPDPFSSPSGHSASNNVASRNGNSAQIRENNTLDVGSISEPYGSEFSGFLIMPRLALDDGKFKLGTYLSSSDVLDKQSILGGVLLGGNLDSDIFVLYDYKRFRPTFFLEFYRQTRHVDDKIFDRDNDVIIYERVFDLNEANLGLRGKFLGDDELRAALVLSRYTQKQEVSAFKQSDRNRRFFPSATYFNGIDLSLGYRYRSIPRTRDRDINPRGGREIAFHYSRTFNLLLKGFREDTSVLAERYNKFFYNQLTLDWREYRAIPWNRSTLALRFYLGVIDEEVDDFFDYHIGGINYMKGYTFYGLEGRKAVMAKAIYRFPIFKNIRKRFLHLYLDKIYGAVYGDIGRAWDKSSIDFRTEGYKKDIGGQLRLDLVSFYGVPTRIAFDATYGFDEVNSKDPLKFYFSLLFGYLN